MKYYINYIRALRNVLRWQKDTSKMENPELFLKNIFSSIRKSKHWSMLNKNGLLRNQITKLIRILRKEYPYVPEDYSEEFNSYMKLENKISNIEELIGKFESGEDVYLEFIKSISVYRDGYKWGVYIRCTPEEGFKVFKVTGVNRSDNWVSVEISQPGSSERLDYRSITSFVYYTNTEKINKWNKMKSEIEEIKKKIAEHTDSIEVLTKKLYEEYRYEDVW